MNHAFSTRYFESLVAFSLALATLPALEAQPRCPGNTASVTPRFVQRALIVIPVKINHAGPFDFMVDTGTQVTVIDPSLASELGLNSQGRVGLVSVANYAQASATVLDTLEADSKVVEKSPAIVQDLPSIQAADPRIRGVLGESFLAHFDLLVDYGHKLLCLDETPTLRHSVRGERIPYVPPQHPEDELPFTQRPVVSAHFAAAGTRPILLLVDSGSDGPILLPGSEQPGIQALIHNATLQGRNATVAQRTFAVVPPANIQIGNRILTKITFVTPVRVAKNLPRQHEDGLLPTVLFQRVFISGTGHFVVFDPPFPREFNDVTNFVGAATIAQAKPFNMDLAEDVRRITPMRMLHRERQSFCIGRNPADAARFERTQVFPGRRLPPGD
jgi:predicted aspartyl protease